MGGYTGKIVGIAMQEKCLKIVVAEYEQALILLCDTRID